jgi:hypothetical protein
MARPFLAVKGSGYKKMAGLSTRQWLPLLRGQGDERPAIQLMLDGPMPPCGLRFKILLLDCPSRPHDER